MLLQRYQVTHGLHDGLGTGWISYCTGCWIGYLLLVSISKTIRYASDKLQVNSHSLGACCQHCPTKLGSAEKREHGLNAISTRSCDLRREVQLSPKTSHGTEQPFNLVLHIDPALVAAVPHDELSTSRPSPIKFIRYK